MKKFLIFILIFIIGIYFFFSSLFLDMIKMFFIIFIIIMVLYLLILILNYNKKTIQRKNSGDKENPYSLPLSKKSRNWWKDLMSALWGLFLLLIIILIIVGIVWGIQEITEYKPKPKAQTEKTSKPVYRDEYELKKGEEIIIHIKPNYFYGYKDYGKKYYRQSFYGNKVGLKEIQGEGVPAIHNKDVKKVILSVYEKEGKISVFYSLDPKEIEKIQ